MSCIHKNHNDNVISIIRSSIIFKIKMIIMWKIHRCNGLENKKLSQCNFITCLLMTSMSSNYKKNNTLCSHQTPLCTNYAPNNGTPSSAQNSATLKASLYTECCTPKGTSLQRMMHP